MHTVYGVASCKGGQGKSTTVSMLARLCAWYGARVLAIDLAQPGTTTHSLRDLWPDWEQGDLSSAMLSFQMLAPGRLPSREQAAAALEAVALPIKLISQPSWSGGSISVFPWDDLQGDAAAHLHSERVLEGLINALAMQVDVTFIDFPAEGGPLMTIALAATDRVIVPLTPETPALEGLEAMLRLLARARTSGHDVNLAGILLTRCDQKNKRVFEVVQTIRQSGEVEGEPLGRRLYPYAVRQTEFYEQAFRYGEPIWKRTEDYSQWAAYVLLAEQVLRESGLGDLTGARGGPAQMPPETRIFDVSALLPSSSDVMLADFEKTHATLRV
jgi:cellulose biosynthesis protein BcsQ